MKDDKKRLYVNVRVYKHTADLLRLLAFQQRRPVYRILDDIVTQYAVNYEGPVIQDVIEALREIQVESVDDEQAAEARAKVRVIMAREIIKLDQEPEPIRPLGRPPKTQTTTDLHGREHPGIRLCHDCGGIIGQFPRLVEHLDDETLAPFERYRCAHCYEAKKAAEEGRVYNRKTGPG